MDVCRICLGVNPSMDICTINLRKFKSFVDVVLFCFDIKVMEDSKITTKICTKCYRKTKLFYEFKLLGLNSDKYLKNNVESVINHENTDIKFEEIGTMSDDNLVNNDESEVLIKCEPLEPVKIEETGDNSDEELLSVIKGIKYEFIESSTNVQEEEKRKRGRPKRIKITTASTNERKTICDKCGKTFKNIKAHLESHKVKLQSSNIKCTLCDKTFATTRSRKIHFNRKHLGIKKECPICKKMVICLKVHHLTMHDKESLPLECVSCGRRFMTQSKLNEHVTQHTKDRPYQCDMCPKQFRIKLSLVSHKRSVHDKEKTHLCQFCSKGFFKKYHLQIHLRTHTKEKPYECKECGKNFSSTTILRSHQKIHLDVKTYHCELCDMSFVKDNYLKAHMVSHTKEKRYPCKYCDAKFHRSDHRKRHEWTAHQRHLATNHDFGNDNILAE